MRKNKHFIKNKNETGYTGEAGTAGKTRTADGIGETGKTRRADGIRATGKSSTADGIRDTVRSNTADEPKKITQIYDKTIKKILTLSSTAVINLINGLFDTDYPLDSTITYNWTEFNNDNLKRILADTILTINKGRSYHIEAQIDNDDSIIFRVFEYGYRHAEMNRTQENGACILNFPEPKIIYLSSNGNTPDWYTVQLNFGTQGSFEYTVSAFKYLDTSIKELNEKKMIILIPFQLLRFRDMMKRKRSPENLLVYNFYWQK